MVIKNPYAHVPKETRMRVQSEIDPKDYIYLFRQVLGERGAQDTVVAIFLQKLCAEMRKPEHQILPYYDPDNDTKVLAILNQLNFNPPVIERIERVGPDDATAQRDLERLLGSLQDSAPPVVARRPDHRTAGSSSPSDGTGGAPVVGAGGTHKAKQSANPKGHARSGKRRAGKEETSKDSGQG